MKKEKRVKKINSLFRIIGFLEGTSYLLLLFFAVPMKYLVGNVFFVKLLGMPHGLLFIGYIILAFLIKPISRWKFSTFCIVLTASVVPFGTFYTNKKYLKS